MLTPPRHSNVLIQMIDEVLRLHGRLRTVFAGVNEMTGLSSTESMVLAAVIEAHSAPTVPQIGRSLGHARQIIQRAANALMAEGLISAEPNPHHKRAPLLLPTEKGYALKRKADDRAKKVADAFLRVVDKQKCKRLTEELHELRSEIEAHLRRNEGNDKSRQRREFDRRPESLGVARRKHPRAR